MTLVGDKKIQKPILVFIVISLFSNAQSYFVKKLLWKKKYSNKGPEKF